MFPAKSSQKTTSHFIPSSSATDRPEVINPTPLIALPAELLLNILGNLEDLNDLFSTILTCRRIFHIFQEAQQPLIKSTFARYTCLETDRVIYRVLIQLRRVIQQDIIHRDVVRSIFEIGWRIFKDKHQEELLIPFGRALAWSFVLNNRQSDAVSLLQLIRKGEPPFEWSTRMLSEPPIQPIEDLLEQLLPEENRDGEKHVWPVLDLPLFEIKKSKSKRNTSHIELKDIERDTLLSDGILFRDQSIVVRHSKPYPLKAYSHHEYFHSRPNNNTISRDVMDILAHRPPTIHMLLRRGDLRMAGRTLVDD